MRAVSSIHAAAATRGKFHWNLPRVLTVAGVFATPFALLLIKLHAENDGSAAPIDSHALTIRFAVVGLFACLMTRWCIAWMKCQR